MSTRTQARQREDAPVSVQDGAALDHLPAVTVEELLASLSLALDLAEGRPKGHALRVCYIAASLARELALPRAQRSAAFFAGLLHDVGVPHASETVRGLPRMYEHELFAGSPLQSPAVLAGRVGPAYLGVITEAFHEHAYQGASAVAALNLPPVVAEAVLCHHEKHDGSGFPLGLAGSEVPPVARVVAAADYVESLLASETNPLMARRHVEMGLREQAGRAFHPQVVDALIAAIRGDGFWLGFHNQALLTIVSDLGEPEPRPLGPDTILQAAGTFADIIDAKNTYKRGHSRRVAAFARALAQALGLPEGHVQAIELGALLHDAGMLRVPSRIIDKPEILTVQEMSMLHEHPQESAEIVRAVPGWAPIAGWIASHHERLDGRGYPEGLTAGDIPFESRIIAIADVFEALTANRPHRPALTHDAALAAMRAMSGQTVDPTIFAAFEGVAADVPNPAPAEGEV